MSVCVHDFEAGCEVWSTGQAAAAAAAGCDLAASAARAWESHASRVLWSTGHASSLLVADMMRGCRLVLGCSSKGRDGCRYLGNCRWR